MFYYPLNLALLRLKGPPISGAPQSYMHPHFKWVYGWLHGLRRVAPGIKKGGILLYGWPLSGLPQANI
jgi:hypothetical protein